MTTGEPTNPYYNHTSGQPVQLSRGASGAIRAEFDSVETGFKVMWADLTAAAAGQQFGLIYQGSSATDPVQRNNGTALQNGDLYFNTNDMGLRAYYQGVWYANPTVASVLLKSGGTLTGALYGTNSSWSGVVTAAGFSGVGANLTGFVIKQITDALGFTPANVAGDTFSGTISGTNGYFSGTLSGGTVTQTSDERKKKSWKKLPADFIERLASIKKSGLFVWRRGNRPGVGVGAQSLEAILPEAVHTDEHGVKSVDYGAAALAACVELAREVVALRALLEQRE